MRPVGRSTDLVGGQGVNLVENGFSEHLQWICRRDIPDDGIDLSVEIPADLARKSERFLVQVKTSRSMRTLKSGDWSVSVDRSVCEKYKRSGLLVLLVGVDLSSKSIRWLNLSKALREDPERVTFWLPEGSSLDEASGPELAPVIRAAIEDHKDYTRPPVEALKYRIRELESAYPHFVVDGSILSGKEQFVISPKEGTLLKITVSAKDASEGSKIESAFNFGSPALAELTSFKFVEPAVVPHGEGNATLKITPTAKPIILSISDGTSALQIKSEVAAGFKGFELRTTDEELPFGFTIRGTYDTQQLSFTPHLDYEAWNGRNLTDLSVIGRILAIIRACNEGGSIQIGQVEYGEIRPMMSFNVDEGNRDALLTNVQQLDFWNSLSKLCRRVGAATKFNCFEEPIASQLKYLNIAFHLIEGEVVPGNIGPFLLTPPPDTPISLPLPVDSRIWIKIPMLLSFGAQQVGALPIIARLHETLFQKNGDGRITLKRSSALLELDIEACSPIS